MLRRHGCGRGEVVVSTPLSFIVVVWLFVVPIVVFYFGRVSGYREGLYDGGRSLDRAIREARDRFSRSPGRREP
jgi:hypothetical protein